MPEPERRQVPFEHRLHEIAAADLVQFGTGKGVVPPIPLFLEAIHVVVAEAAEEEVGEGIVARPLLTSPPRCAARSTNAQSAAACRCRRCRASGRTSVPATALPSSVTDHFRPFLVIDSAERPAEVAPLQRQFVREQLVHGHFDVLVQRQAVEFRLRSIAPSLEIDPPRLIVDERAVVSDAGRVAFPSRFRRTEEIVEVRVVPGRPRAPVVSAGSRRAGAAAPPRRSEVVGL